MYDIINRLLNKIKKMHKKLKIKAFYIKKVNKDKSLFAVVIDKIVITIIINFMVALIMYTITKDFLFTFFVFIQFFILYILLIYKIKKDNYNIAIKKINHNLVRKKISNDINNMNAFEFNEYIKNVMQNSEIRDLEIAHQRNIDIIGILANSNVAIKCIKSDLEYKVNINDIKEFVIELKNLDFEMGIIITNGYFSDDVKEVISKIKKQKKIFLVDFDHLMVIIRELGEYPSEREIRSIILDRTIVSDNKIKINRKELFSNDKVLRYFVFGSAIYLFGKLSLLKTYYILMGYILMVFGFISFGNYLLKIFNIRDN